MVHNYNFDMVTFVLCLILLTNHQSINTYRGDAAKLTHQQRGGDEVQEILHQRGH